jgi:hypothetical protein
MSDLIAIARNQRRLNLRTHYEGCEADHIECLVVKLADEVERLRAEGERLRAALQSIAKSTCCDRCNEAALVAREALEEDGR